MGQAEEGETTKGVMTPDYSLSGVNRSGQEAEGNIRQKGWTQLASSDT